MTSQPALFLDRDGVVNIDKGYVHKPEDCEFVAGIFDLVKRANVLGFKVFIVTNQAGIARGYYSEAQFLQFSEWMKAEFSRHEAALDAIYFCPHHPVHGLGQYHIECDCRKPRPGMFLQAKAEFNINMQNSVMVGDNLSDIQAANTAMVGTQYLLSHVETDSPRMAEPLISNASVILKNIGHLNEVILQNQTRQEYQRQSAKA